MDAENQYVVSTDKCNVHSIDLRDKNLISKENPTLYNDNLVTLPKNEINFTKIESGKKATLPQNERNFSEIESDKGAIKTPQEITIFANEIQNHVLYGQRWSFRHKPSMYPSLACSSHRQPQYFIMYKY